MAKPNKNKKPQARLEDLEVREVSLVDRPANQRAFLIVKRRDDMPRRAIPASEAEPVTVDKNIPQAQAQPAEGDEVSFFDILGIGELPEADPQQAAADGDTPSEGGDAPEADGDTPSEGGDAPEADPQQAAADGGDTDPAEEPTDPGAQADPAPPAGTEPVTKAPQVLEQATDLLQRLTAEVNVLKGEGEVNDTHRAQLEALARDLAALAGVELGEVAKGDDSPLRVATGAMERMISLIATLQGAGEAEVPAEVPGELAEVAKAIGGLAAPDQAEPEPEPQAAEPEPLFEVFKAAGADGQGDDPMLVIKAGAKMKKARLSQFEAALKALNGILAELKGIPKADAEGKAQKVTKADHSAMLATITTLLDGIKTSIAARLEGIEKSIGGVAERVTRIENTRPAGNGEADPEPVQKSDPTDDSKPEFWAGVL